MNNFAKFQDQLQAGAVFFKEHFDPKQAVTIVHHNDADGLSSALIASTAVERLGGTVRRIALEKPYPDAVTHIQAAQEEGVILYLDFAGRSAPEIAARNTKQRPILILDHHLPTPIADPWVMNVNPMFCGLAGDRDLSAAGVVYLFALELGAANKDMAHMAVLGAVGDGQDHGDAFTGLNADFIAAAVEQRTLRLASTGGVRRGSIPRLGNASVEQMAGDVTTLGAVGYLEAGVDQGLELLEHGYTDELRQSLAELQQMQQEKFAGMERTLRQGGLQSTEHIQWFDLCDAFYPMGVKMVGVFCSNLRDQDWLDPGKYIAGFQWIPDYVPGLGAINFDATKVSMRMPSSLAQRMFAGQMPTLLDFLPAATQRLGGFVDGCHSYSAATTVAKGSEGQLVTAMEEILAGLV